MFSTLFVVCAVFSNEIISVLGNRCVNSNNFGGISLKSSVGIEKRLIYDDVNEDTDSQPLFLTPYIESGNLEEGREKANVLPLAGVIKSYAGFLTVNKWYNSNMFFWYFESERDPNNSPLLVWLQGGPGSSSLFGLFIENGPYVIHDDERISIRNTYWSQRFNVIYIDNPVGTGFSFTENDEGYVTNEIQVGRNLLDMLIQFLTLFPNLKKNSLYITGESYAGKYIPAFAYAIHINNDNPSTDFKINLKGLFIGDGWCDPINMINYGELLYNLGLFDENARDTFKTYEASVAKMIKKKKYMDANELLEYIMTNSTSLYANLTGLDSYYNYYDTESGNWLDYNGKFVNSKRLREAIHVGKTPFVEGGTVYSKLRQDIPKSAAPWIAFLLDHYPIVFYNGQLDIICAYSLTDNFLNKLNWSGKAEFKDATRNIFKVRGKVAGYYKIAGNLIEIMIRDAGHMVPADQPEWALQMLIDFIPEMKTFS